jgi:amidase
MASEDWKIVSERKQKSNLAKIKPEWRLSSTYAKGINADSNEGVLTVPAKCGILNEREIDLTENYDATSLLQKIARKEARLDYSSCGSDTANL